MKNQCCYFSAAADGLPPLFFEGGYLNRTKPLPLDFHCNHGYEFTFLLRGNVAWLVSDGTVLELFGGMGR